MDANVLPVPLFLLTTAMGAIAGLFSLLLKEKDRRLQEERDHNQRLFGMLRELDRRTDLLLKLAPDVSRPEPEPPTPAPAAPERELATGRARP